MMKINIQLFGGRGAFSSRYIRKIQDESINKKKVGTFDIKKYTDQFNVTTNDVVLTDWAKEHIEKGHPEVKKHYKDIPKILKEPDAVLIDNKNADTLWLVKKIDKNVKITLKINTVENQNEKGFKNSILQMQYMREKEIRRNIRVGNATKVYDNGKIDLNIE